MFAPVVYKDHNSWPVRGKKKLPRSFQGENYREIVSIVKNRTDLCLTVKRFNPSYLMIPGKLFVGYRWFQMLWPEPPTKFCTKTLGKGTVYTYTNQPAKQSTNQTDKQSN
jgi:hypothetical protein